MGRPKLDMLDLIDSNVDLFMYLIVGIGFGTWKYWHLNWAEFCPCNQKWETSGRSRGWVWGSGGPDPPHPNWCLFEQYSFSKAVFSVPTVTCVRRLRNMCLSLWEVILKKFNISFWTKVWTLPSPQAKIPGSAPGNTIIHSREWKT